MRKLSFVSIRKAMKGTNLEDVTLPSILDPSNFKSYWISWTAGVIRVGQGTVVGNGVFMTLNDSAPSPVNYIALTGWSVSGKAFFNDGL